MSTFLCSSRYINLSWHKQLKGVSRGTLFLFFLCVALLLTACSDVVNLRSGLTDADANEIIAALNKEGIEARKATQKEGVNLTVKSTDLSRATDILQAAGLPRRSLSNLGQVFKKEGMISTPLEERIRYIHGLSEELEYTLQQFDHVITARVHVVLPERIAPGEPVQPSSAAVFIKYRGSLDEDMITPRIRKLVASSIPGLSSEDGQRKVSVVLAPSDPLPAGIAWREFGPFMVAADSLSSIRSSFIAMSCVILLLLLLSIFLVLKDRPSIKKWLSEHIGKPKPLTADSGHVKT